MAAFDRLLILETSQRVGQVALASEASLVAEERLAGGSRRASDLTGVVARLLTTQGWHARDLTAVVVGLGPGSYTGLRVGLASAKALAFAVGCEFFGVETFAAIARLAPEKGSIVVVGDALQGKVFHRAYAWDDELRPTTALRIIDRAAARDTVNGQTWVTGPGVELLEIAGHTPSEPRPMGLLHVARDCPWACERDAWIAEPYYLRGSSAEEVFAQRQLAANG